MFTAHQAFGHPNGWVASVTDDDGELFCEVSGEVNGEVTNRAKQIALACNEFPHLLEALRGILPLAEIGLRELNAKMVGSLYPSINNAAMNRAINVLARIDSK